MANVSNHKKLKLKLEDGSIVTGKTNIGNSRRLSDYLNRSDNLFIVLFDVHSDDMQEGVLFINRSRVVWAVPMDDRGARRNCEEDLCLEIAEEEN